MSRTPKSSKIKQKQLNKIIQLHKNKQFELTKKEAIKLLKIEPKNTTILKILINVSDSLDDKKSLLLKLIYLEPKYNQAYIDLYYIYRNENDYIKAKSICLEAINLFPSKASGYIILSDLYQNDSKYTLAKEAYEEGMIADSVHIDLKFLYGLLCLKMGEYKKGFEFYRYRYHENKINGHTTLKFPEGLLEKGTDIKGKTVLFTDDQGYGDMIQFIRYIPIFENMGAKVQIIVHKLLHKLFAFNYPQCIVTTNKLSIDYHAPLIDAAYFLETSPQTIPFQDGYLTVDQNDSNLMHNKYFSGITKKKIGIIWRSNSRNEESFSEKKYRQESNCSLDDFLKFFNLDNIQLFSLQVSVTDEEKELLYKNNILSLGDNFVDFYDNAVIIDNLDIVIGIGTASVLIAGAMGKKAIALISHQSYWIWGIDSIRMDWFRNISIVRKEKNDDWNTTLEKAAQLEVFEKNIDTVAALMNIAIEHHQNMNLEEAESCYRKVLVKEPENADAYHYLGLIAFQTGHAQQAIVLIQKAIKLNPTLDEAYENLQKIITQLSK